MEAGCEGGGAHPGTAAGKQAGITLPPTHPFVALICLRFRFRACHVFFVGPGVKKLVGIHKAEGLGFCTAGCGVVGGARGVSYAGRKRERFMFFRPRFCCHFVRGVDIGIILRWLAAFRIYGLRTPERFLLCAWMEREGRREKDFCLLALPTVYMVVVVVVAWRSVRLLWLSRNQQRRG